ncbi:MAG: hypothetical protein GYB67_04385 [Chloroflexi bacterium]|nr:hypothetical protein [Chloroflexota bacterium]
MTERTPLAEKLLEVVRSKGGAWMNRREIASVLGRPEVLSPYDIKLLDQLIAAGHIEKREFPIGPVQKEFRYRSVTHTPPSPSAGRVTDGM